MGKFYQRYNECHFMNVQEINNFLLFIIVKMKTSVHQNKLSLY